MLWFRFDFCSAEGAQQLCPPGMNVAEDCPLGAEDCYECPAHRDCYVKCSEQHWGAWIQVPGSPYNDAAFCERFPRADSGAAPPAEGWTYLAQAGKAEVPRTNFDSIFNAVVTIFQILTGASALFQCLHYALSMNHVQHYWQLDCWLWLWASAP